MSDDQEVWPLPRYEVGPFKIVHALGVVAAKYNSLEFILLTFLLRYSGLPNTTCQYLFANSNNNLRQELLRRCVAEREPDEEVRDRVLHFIKCFGACAENRNFLMHSMSAKSPMEGMLNFSKATKNEPTKVNAIDLKLEDVRRVADEIALAEGFGARLSAYINFRGAQIDTSKIPADALLQLMVMLKTLPEKPDMPRSLLALRSSAS